MFFQRTSCLAFLEMLVAKQFFFKLQSGYVYVRNDLLHLLTGNFNLED